MNLLVFRKGRGRRYREENVVHGTHMLDSGSFLCIYLFSGEAGNKAKRILFMVYTHLIPAHFCEFTCFQVKERQEIKRRGCCSWYTHA